MRNLNWLSEVLMFSLIIIVIVLYFNHPKATKVDYVELRSTYKNCIIVHKEIENGRYKLKLYNPTKHKILKQDNITVVYVNDYIYWNIYFVGDTIK